MRLLESHPFTAAQLLIRLKAEGYTGSYTILKRFVREVRPRRAPAYLTLHFAPGQCAQADWGSWGTIRVGSTRRALSFFVMVLCHSRRLFVEFTVNQGQELWHACHQHAFDYYDGLVPAEIMVDNLKTAVLSRPIGRAAGAQSRVRRFCEPPRLRDQALRAVAGKRKGTGRNRPSPT